MVVTEVASFKEGEWPSYRSGQFNRGKMVMLQRWLVYCRENSHVTEVVTLMEGKWSCYGGGQFREGEWSYYVGGQFNGGRMIMLQSWIVSCRENGHITEVVTNGGRRVMLQRWSV